MKFGSLYFASQMVELPKIEDSSKYRVRHLRIDPRNSKKTTKAYKVQSLGRYHGIPGIAMRKPRIQDPTRCRKSDEMLRNSHTNSRRVDDRLSLPNIEDVRGIQNKVSRFLSTKKHEASKTTSSNRRFS